MDTSAYTELFSGKLGEAQALVRGTGTILNHCSTIIVLQRVVFCQKEKSGTMHWNTCCWVLFRVWTCVHRHRQRDTAARRWFYMKQDWGWDTQLRFWVTVLHTSTDSMHTVAVPAWDLATFLTLVPPMKPPCFVHMTHPAFNTGVNSVQLVLVMKGVAGGHGVCRESISFCHNIVQSTSWDANEKLLRTLWCLYPSVAAPASGPSYSFINHLEIWWRKCT